MNEEFNIHFGSIGQPLPNWRDEGILYEDSGNDDNLPVSADVLAILGFDPDGETYDDYVYGLDEVIDAWEEVQPRVPAGNPDGGQWTSEGGGGSNITFTHLYDAARAMLKVKFTDSEIDSIKRYTGHEYFVMNKHLREGDLTEFWENDLANKMDSYLDKAPKYKGESYRGMIFQKGDFDDFVNNIKVGSVVMDRAYLSSTANIEGLNSFHSEEDRQLNILVKIKGKSGVYVAQHSANNSENEILFKRKSKFKVASMDKNTSFVKAGWGKTLLFDATIHLEEI